MAYLFALGLMLLSSLAWSSTILVMGDSLSAAYGMPAQQGWVYLLEQRLQQQGYNYRVVNASVSGETTHGGLNRLPQALATHQPEVVILELGANDGLRGTPLSLIERNLTQMIRKSQDLGASVILLEMRIPPNYGPRYSQGFQDLFARVSEQQNIQLIPFFLAPVVQDEKLMQSDGLHPNAAAQPVLLDQLWPPVLTLLQK